MELHYTLIAAGVALGIVSISVDLGSRLLGSSARYRLGKPLCVAIITVACFVPATPAFLLLAFPGSPVALAAASAAALLGCAVFLHYLFPYRSGVRRAREARPRPPDRQLAGPVALKEAAIKMPTLPPAAEGLTLLLISDIHCTAAPQVEFVEECFGALKSAGPTPDLICICGDLGEDDALLPRVVDALAALPCRVGAYCVRGNHDLEFDRGDVLRRLLEESPIRLLANEAVTLPDLDVALVGVESPWVAGPPPQTPQAGLRIALSHTPDNVAVLRRMGIDLALSGHTHGGRFRMPVIGSLCVPSARGRFLNVGLFRLGGMLLYISGGVGSQFGGVGAIGEIVLLRLER